MKKLFIIFMLLFSLATYAQEQKSRTDLTTDINTYVGAGKKTTGPQLNEILKNIIWSSWNIGDDSSELTEFENLTLKSGANRTINIAQAADGEDGDDLYIESGLSGDGAYSGDIYIRTPAMFGGEVHIHGSEVGGKVGIESPLYMYNNAIYGITRAFQSGMAVEYDQFIDMINTMPVNHSETSDTATYALNLLNESSFTITLPANTGTLTTTATACTDFPVGWIITASEDNLLINHGQGKYYSTISIKYNVSGDEYRLARPFDNAYQGILETDNDHIIIEGYCSFYNGSKTQIKITF